MRRNGRFLRGRTSALAVCIVATGLFAAPVEAAPNRCGTSPPTRSPTWEDGFGYHWFDPQGVWTQGPDGTVFGHAGVDFTNRTVQADLWVNHSLQAYVGLTRRCVLVGSVGVGAPAIGEFALKPAPGIVSMPWLARDGRLFRADDGRTTILRGLDYPYNEEIFERPYNLTDLDFERIASWGINLLRVRIASYRSGFLPGTQAEPGYWENLDHIIAAANRHGIYVLPATVTGDLEAMQFHPDHERLKFVRGTPNHTWWMNFQAAVFERYRGWPGVVGFDTVNEDNSYPPFVHDRLFMGPAHQDISARLRERDGRHIYFQEPSGWSYWGAEFWPGMMNGFDIGDANRFFCPKWKADGDSGLDLDTKGGLADESNAPMFICEFWITRTGEDGTVLAQQREVLRAMDERLIGGVRVLYGPSNGYGTQLSDGSEAPWVREFVRPYPVWVGGVPRSIDYDFDTRRLALGLTLDGSGDTEVYVPLARSYPTGFVAVSSSGGRLVHDGTGVRIADGMAWDASRSRVVLPAHAGEADVTIEPRTDLVAPSVSIVTPADGATYAHEEAVAADYACGDGEAGSGIYSCDGPVAAGARVDTATLGSHTFEVTATDNEGNSASRAVAYQVVDRTAPEITIRSPQDGAVYAAGDAVLADFECVDAPGASGVTACTGTVPDGAAVDTSAGPHAFTVTALDAAGNGATHSVFYTVADTTPPETTLTLVPPAVTHQTSATFAFTGADDTTPSSALAFECSLDGAPFSPCSSPATFSGLAPGGHTLRVRSVDHAGNADPTPAAHAWDVRYSTGGFEGNVTAPPVVNPSPGGKVWALRWRLHLDGRAVTTLAAVSAIEQASYPCGGEPSSWSVAAPHAATELRFDEDAQQYVFNWRVPSAPACHAVAVRLADGTNLDVRFAVA